MSNIKSLFNCKLRHNGLKVNGLSLTRGELNSPNTRSEFSPQGVLEYYSEHGITERSEMTVSIYRSQSQQVKQIFLLY